jgi:hypothetical protein
VLRLLSLFAAVGTVAALTAAGASARTGVRGPEVDVSRARGFQAETTIAVDPSNPQTLLAASNTEGDRNFLAVYGSTDGGATWTTLPNPEVPPAPVATCAAGDPVVAIDAHGRQYVGFLTITPCDLVEDVEPALVVATRPDAASPWQRAVVVAPGAQFDDKPALAVDTTTGPQGGRVYVAWTRGDGRGRHMVVSHSDDTGTTWSRPVRTDRQSALNSYASLAVGPAGDVYLTWNGIANEVRLSRSTDGGDHFSPDRIVDRNRQSLAGSCGSSIGRSIPAQPRRCVRPNPIVSVDGGTGPRSGTVYVTYSADGGARHSQDVFVAALDRALRPLVGRPAGRRKRVNPADGRTPSDQFWPASAVDPATGRVWACFYDTRGDARRRRTYFSCTASSDGARTWARPVHAATVPSNMIQPGASHFEYGDYEGLAVSHGLAHPIWTDTRNLRRFDEEVFTTTLTDADVP